MNHSVTITCRACGRSLSGQDTDGICAACLWDSFVENPVEESGERHRPPLFRLPGHEVLEEIARGGMGIVYRAKQLEPPRSVAVKMLLPYQAASKGMRERFGIESRAIAALDHPGILPIYQVGEHDGLPYFTLKLATGGTLSTRARNYHGKWRETAALLIQLADAVHFAHEHGVLHRDLKPGNVLFDESGRPYVSDFGLAKELSTDTDLTRSTDFLGTPHYVAPEVAARSARAATVGSDVYALGAILYELLTGRPPFQAEGIPALLKKIAEEEPIACGRLLAESGSPLTVPRDLDIICLKCLAKEPARRYSSARELAEDLRRWLQGEPILARETNAAEKLWLWSRRHRVTAMLIATVLVLLVTLVIGLSISAVRIADSRRAALRTVEALEAQKASDLLEQSNTADGIALLARRVRESPKNLSDITRLMLALQHRRWAIPVRAPIQPDHPNSIREALQNAALARDAEGRVLALFIGNEVRGYDVATGTNRFVWPLPFRPASSMVEENSQVVLLSDTNNQAWVLHYASGRMLAQAIPIPEASVGLMVRISSDARHAFYIAPDLSGRLLALSTGQSRALVPALPGRSDWLAGHPRGEFFPNGKRLAFSDRDRTVRVLDLETGELTGPAVVAAKSVAAILISPDGTRMMTGSIDDRQFWNLESGKEITLPATGVSFNGTFHPDGRRLYLGGNHQGLVIVNPDDGSKANPGPAGFLQLGTCVAEPNGKFVSVGFERGGTIFDALTGLPVCEPLPHEQARMRAPRYDGGEMVTLGADGMVIRWQAKSNQLRPVIVRHSEGIQSAHFSRNGERFVTASDDGTAQVWDTRSGVPVGARLKHQNRVRSACFSPDGRRVATAAWDATARIWDAETGAALCAPLRASNWVFHVAFSPDGSRLLAAGEDGVVRVYDGISALLLMQLKHSKPVYWAQFSPDGKLIVSRPLWSNPRLWDAISGKLIQELVEPEPHLNSTAAVCMGDFSDDGRWLALASHHRYATLWRLPEGRLHAVLPHTALVRTATFDPKARRLLTTDDGLTGQLWEVATGVTASAPLVHPQRQTARPNTGNSLRAAAIHPAGHLAVTGGSDGALRFWDVVTGYPLGDPLTFGGSVMSAEFSPDGQFLLVACLDGTASVLPMPPQPRHAPRWLAPLAEALVGRRFNPTGAAESVSPTALWEECERVRSTPGAAPEVHWARQMLGL